MNGYVIVGATAYENSYVEDGKAVRLVLCPLCRDTGRHLTDDGTEGEYCDCRSGMAQNESTGWWDL